MVVIQFWAVEETITKILAQNSNFRCEIVLNHKFSEAQQLFNYIEIISLVWNNVPFFFKLESLNLPAVFQRATWLWENWCLQWL